MTHFSLDENNNLQSEPEHDISAVDEDAEEIEAAKHAMRNKLFDIANSLSARRTDARAEVFKPSHNLAKYTVEQAGLIELEEVCSCMVIVTLARWRFRYTLGLPCCTGNFNCAVSVCR
jgi:hypothetical protein